MPGLFDKMKEGLLAPFGGGGKATTQAGAAALIASGQGAQGLAPLGYAAQTGMQVRMMLEEKALQEQNQRELAALIAEVGMSPDGLMQIFLKTLGSGMVEEAKYISEIYKSLGSQQQQGVNTQMVDVPISAAPPEVQQRWPGVTTLQVPRNPRTNAYDFYSALPAAPKETTEKNSIQPMSAEAAAMFGFPTGGNFSGIIENGVFIPRQLLTAQETGIMDIASQRLNEITPQDWVSVGSMASTMERMRGEGFFARGARFLGGLFTGPDAEIANSAAGMALMAMQQDLSGKQMTEAERTFMDGFMMPRVTDTDETKIAKGRLITTYVNARGNGASTKEAVKAVATVYNLPFVEDGSAPMAPDESAPDVGAPARAWNDRNRGANGPGT